MSRAADVGATRAPATARAASLGRRVLPALLAVATAPSLGAPPPPPAYNSSDAMKDANAPKELPRTEAPPAPLILQQEETPEPDADGRRILIRDFRVEGADFLDAEELLHTLEPYRGRELSFEEIKVAANRVTVLCRNKGYLIARALVPRQVIHDGVLLIQVIPGRYGSFNIQDASRVRSETLEGIFGQARGGSDVVTRDGLERAMLLAADLPGTRMPVVSIGPGAEAGTADFSVAAAAAPLLDGYALADRYGSQFTGKDRLSAGLDINSPLHIGDRVSLNGLATNAAGLRNARAAYSLPLSYDGLRGEIAVSKTTYKLGGDYENLNADGVADALEASVSYPLRRARDDRIDVSLTVAGRYLRDDIATPVTSTTRHAGVATFAVQRQFHGRLFGLDSQVEIGGGLTAGRLDFGNAAERVFNERGADTEGDYAKATFSYGVLQALTERWSLATSLRAQVSLKRNLDGSEQLSISGPGGIKSYPDGVTNDNGFLLGAQLKYALAPAAALRQALGLFFDFGQVGPEHGWYTTVGKVAIGDAGLSYEAEHGGAFGRMDLARTTGGQAATAQYNDRWKFLAELGVRF